MDTIVLKFGGSSVADNEKLKMVANKIIDSYNKEHNIVVVLSAQGKTTDKLIGEAKELEAITDNINTKQEHIANNEAIEKSTTSESYNRELATLLSTGEQISIAKLSILLNAMGYQSISLTGWQAGIFTNDANQNAMIEKIDTTRILQELEKRKIVIIAGFQGINENMDITTLGRGGSDTTAVAIAAALKAKNCYIFSDVDGVYTTDPNKIENAHKLHALSYQEMKEISDEGAKVLHNRCVEIGEKFKIPIITKSTFNNKLGTVISDIIEENTVKSLVKKDVSRISIIGNGIMRDTNNIRQLLDIIDEHNLEVLELDVSESKISLILKNIISDKILNDIHDKLFHKI